MSKDSEMIDFGGASKKAKRSLITKILIASSSTFLFSMMALTFADVVGRYFFNAPIHGASEIIAFLLGLTIFTAFPLITHDRVHISVGMFEQFLKGPFRYFQRLVVLIGSLGFLGFVTWLMFDQGRTMYEADFLTEYLDLPMAPIVLALAFLSGIATLMFIGVIWRYLKNGGDPEGPKKPQSGLAG